jgi:hypothetical protein
MASTVLRRLFSPRPDSARQLDPETLRQLHASLVNERQQLRSDGAPADELERNRLAIVHCQWELSRALIDRHLAPAASPAAA